MLSVALTDPRNWPLGKKLVRRMNPHERTSRGADVVDRVTDHQRDTLRLGPHPHLRLDRLRPSPPLRISSHPSGSNSTLETQVASIPHIVRTYDVSVEVALLGVSLFVIGFAAGPLIFGPASELYGRRPVYVFCGVFFSGQSCRVSFIHVQSTIDSDYWPRCSGRDSCSIRVGRRGLGLGRAAARLPLPDWLLRLGVHQYCACLDRRLHDASPTGPVQHTLRAHGLRRPRSVPSCPYAASSHDIHT